MLESDTSTTRSENTENSQNTEPPAQPRKRAPRKAAAKAGTKAAAPPAADESAPQAAESAPPPRKRATRKAAAEAADPAAATAEPAPAKKATKRAAAKKAPAKKAAAQPAAEPAAGAQPGAGAQPETRAQAAEPAPAKKPARKRAAKKAADAAAPTEAPPETDGQPDGQPESAAMTAPGVLFMAPADEAPRRRRASRRTADRQQNVEPEPADTDIAAAEDAEDQTAEPEDVREAAIEQASGARRRRRRGRRGRGGGGKPAEAAEAEQDEDAVAEAEATEDVAEPGTRRRRRRRRSGAEGDEDVTEDDPPNTVTHVREPKSRQTDGDDGVRAVKGSTRLEAKRQRRKDGRETTRRRAPILSEAEFLARREAVDRVMAVRQNGDRTQIAVLEDDILVEHYVTRASSTSYVGNVYLGRVQNVLPSMEAAFVDIGKGRNGVLYAGEVNWDAAGLEGKSRAIENALKSGDAVLVQVTKDPIGHKGARLTSQISLPGRFLVYVPGGGMTGISRRLPDTERHRLKTILKKIVPEDAGVIVRTAAEGASEEDLTRDVERLTAQWASIEKKAKQTKSAPTLVHGEPDLATRVVRDVFNEDFKSLIVQGDDAWATVSEYVEGVAPDLAERVSRHTKDTDLFHDLRVDEQLMKALDRKVWLPSGGSLVIDRTEAMTVIDVNTGKFVGAGGNLEQTVTRNNLEAAEEIVRQLRLRDVGGIVVIDFIDMVLESNRELVLRRLTECLGRDRTKHQVAEVTSLGLVQMTRKRVGEGLLEAFSETCDRCHGRGVLIHGEPVDKPGGASSDDEDRGHGKGKRKRGGRGGGATEAVEPAANDEQRKAASAAIAAIHRAANGGKEDDQQIGLIDELATGLVAAVMDEESRAESADGPQPEAEEVVAAPAEVEVDQAPPAEEPRAEVDQTPPAEEPPTEEPPTEEPPGEEPATAAARPRRRRRAASRPAGPPGVAS